MKFGRAFAAASVFLLCFFFVFGCTKKPAATVNGEPITEEMVSLALGERVSEHGSQGVNVDKEPLRRAVIEQLIAEKLLLQGARELKIAAADAEIDAEINAMKKAVGEDAFKKGLKAKGLTIDGFRKTLRNRITILKFIDNLVPVGSVKEEEIRSYYATSTVPFLKPESVEVRFIQTATEDEARAIMKELRSGKISFDSLADSLDKEKKAITSDYGWTKTDFFGPEIAAGLKNLKKGAYGGPYKGKDAYFILCVRDRQPQRPETLDEAKEKISNTLLERKRQGAVAHWVADRRAKGKVVLN